VAQATKPKPQQVAADTKPQQIAEAPTTPSDGGNASAPAQAQSNSFDSRWSTAGFSR
jgi:hypothetical protein